jgi:hypothetical protein
MTIDAHRQSRFALVVANSTYDDPTLRQLRAPSRDAEELARVLGDPAIGGFTVEQSTDEPQHMLQRRIARFFSDKERDDILLLHISGHGVKDEDGNLYFAAADTESDHLDATGVAAEFLNRQMAKSRSRSIVLFLDCCFSGAFARGALARGSASMDVGENFDGQGKVVLTSSNSAEYSFEGTDVEGRGDPSYFTTAIVRGIESGAADRDGDDRVSVDELYDYVYDEVRRRTPNQTPCKWVFDVRGDIYVARNPRPAPITTEALPAPVLAQLAELLPSAREGAVGDLKQLLGAREERVAKAAGLALTELLDDDSRRVREAAAAALAAAVPRPSLHTDSVVESPDSAAVQVGPIQSARPAPPAPVEARPAPQPQPQLAARPPTGVASRTDGRERRVPTWGVILGIAAGLCILGAAFLPVGGSFYGRFLSIPGLRFSKYVWAYLDPLVMGSTILVLAVRGRRDTERARFAAMFMVGAGVMTAVGGVGAVLYWHGLPGTSVVSPSNGVWCLGGVVAVAAAVVTIRGIGTRPAQSSSARPVAAWICLAGAAIVLAGLVVDLGGGYRILSGGSPPSWYLGIEPLAGIAVTLVVVARALRRSAGADMETVALIAVGLQSVLFFLYYACSWVPYGFDFAIGDLVGLAGGALVLGGGIALWRGQSRARAAQPAASAVGGGAAVAG